MSLALMFGMLRFLVATAPGIFILWKTWHDSGMTLEDFEAQHEALGLIDVDEILGTKKEIDG